MLDIWKKSNKWEEERALLQTYFDRVGLPKVQIPRKESKSHYGPEAFLKAVCSFQPVEKHDVSDCNFI